MTIHTLPSYLLDAIEEELFEQNPRFTENDLQQAVNARIDFFRRSQTRAKRSSRW